MSPAPLHLERYIGSCLISAGIPHPHHHHNNHFQKKDPTQIRYRRYPPSPQCHQTGADFCGNLISGNNAQNMNYSPRTWTPAAGLPLISMSPASPRRGGIIKDKQPDERLPLSRLAIHTQGAPLIQAGRQQPRLVKQNNKQQKKEKESKDCSSVASDESSGNSENSLPRIIKPRKRRKKDRKPQVTSVGGAPTVVGTTQSTVESIQESAIVTLKPYTPLCQDFASQNSNNNNIIINGNKNNNHIINNTITPIIEEIKRTNKVLKQYQIDENIGNSAPCQCRYCDPINLTWDVDQRCYSPYLTPPTNFTSTQDWESDSRGSSLEVSSEIITSPNGHRDIEIKFFSTSPPIKNTITTPPRPISITPPWPN